MNDQQFPQQLLFDIDIAFVKILKVEVWLDGANIYVNE